MKVTFGSVISYLGGLSLVAFGLFLMIWNALGVIPVLAGIVILPVVRRQVAKRAGVEFSRGAAASIGVLGGVAAMVVVGLVVISAIGGGGSVDANSSDSPNIEVSVSNISVSMSDSPGNESDKDGSPGGDVSNVNVTAQGTNLTSSSKALDIVWNSRAQSGIDPDPNDIVSYSPNEGQKHLVLRMEITNVGNDSVEPTPRLFRIQSNNVEYEYARLFGSGNGLFGVTLNPGGTYSGWVAFTIPEGATEAELIVSQDAYPRERIAISFTHDPEMPINMSD